MREFFGKYIKIFDIIKGIKDPDLLKHLNDTLDYMKSKIFKSDEYLDSILDKNIEDVTPQDIHDILCKFSDPFGNVSWWSTTTIHDRCISSHMHDIMNQTHCLLK